MPHDATRFADIDSSRGAARRNRIRFVTVRSKEFATAESAQDSRPHHYRARRSRLAWGDAGIFETRIAEEFRDAGPDAFKGYDVAVLVYADKNPEDRWTEQTRNLLLDFVRSGKGLVVYHHSTTAFKDWPEYARLCGGNYYGNAQHADIHDFTVDFVDHEHPITRGLARSFVESQDELYANMAMQPQGTYHVLATAWDDHSLYHGKSKAPLIGPGNNEPIMWTVEAGKGRVFATMIGHSAKAAQSAGFRATFTRGVEWAATGSVTQPVPPEMADARN